MKEQIEKLKNEVEIKKEKLNQEVDEKRKLHDRLQVINFFVCFKLNFFYDYFYKLFFTKVFRIF